MLKAYISLKCDVMYDRNGVTDLQRGILTCQFTAGGKFERRKILILNIYKAFACLTLSSFECHSSTKAQFKNAFNVSAKKKEKCQISLLSP